MDVIVQRKEPNPPPAEKVIIYLNEAEARSLGELLGRLSRNRIKDVMNPTDLYTIDVVESVVIELYGSLRKEFLVP